MSDNKVTLLILGSFFVILLACAWVQLFAPCSALGWMPVTDLPSRCLR